MFSPSTHPTSITSQWPGGLPAAKVRHRLNYSNNHYNDNDTDNDDDNNNDNDDDDHDDDDDDDDGILSPFAW